MKIAFMTMEQFEHKPADSVGSSRIRARWLIKNWPDAEQYRIGKQYDAIIFQKVYDLPFMRTYTGFKVLDMCDPDWMERDKPVKEAIDLCDVVTTSTQALADFVKQMTDKPVIYVPDRIELTEHMTVKQHHGRARTVAWFGYSQNQKALDQALIPIKRMGLDLLVISDLPYVPVAAIAGIDDEWLAAHVKNVKYDYSTAHQELVYGADLVINPRLESGRFMYKSNNKTLTAWALGLPVAETAEEMEKLLEEDARKYESGKRLAEIKEAWDVKLSVKQMQDIIAQYASTK